jgi:hypothetical protein
MHVAARSSPHARLLFNPRRQPGLEQLKQSLQQLTQGCKVEWAHLQLAMFYVYIIRILIARHNRRYGMGQALRKKRRSRSRLDGVHIQTKSAERPLMEEAV